MGFSHPSSRGVMNKTNPFPRARAELLQGAAAPLPEPAGQRVYLTPSRLHLQTTPLLCWEMPFPFSFSTRAVLEVMQTAFIPKAQGLKPFAFILCFC